MLLTYVLICKFDSNLKFPQKYVGSTTSVYKTIYHVVRQWMIIKQPVSGFTDFLNNRFIYLSLNLTVVSFFLITIKARSDLKKRIYFNFSSFFGDFCLKVYGIEVIAYLSWPDSYVLCVCAHSYAQKFHQGDCIQSSSKVVDSKFSI